MKLLLFAAVLLGCSSQESALKLCGETLPAWGLVRDVKVSATDSWGDEVCSFDAVTPGGVHVYGRMVCGVSSCRLSYHVCEIHGVRVLRCLHENDSMEGR